MWLTEKSFLRRAQKASLWLAVFPFFFELQMITKAAHEAASNQIFTSMLSALRSKKKKTFDGNTHEVSADKHFAAPLKSAKSYFFRFESRSRRVARAHQASILVNLIKQAMLLDAFDGEAGGLCIFCFWVLCLFSLTKLYTVSRLLSNLNSFHRTSQEESFVRFTVLVPAGGERGSEQNYRLYDNFVAKEKET